jgi:protein-disulfide isomerase
MIFALFQLSISVAKRYPGFLWGPDPAQVHLEVYADPLCPECRVIWPTLQTLLARYPTQLSVRVHLVNLPYHTWSFYTVRAVYALKAISPDSAKKMIEALYADGDQDKFSNSALQDVPESKIPEHFADYVSNKFKVDRAAYLQKFQDPVARSEASATFGFGATHSVDGTPTVFLNGVATELGTDTPMSTWTRVIDDLLK